MLTDAADAAALDLDPGIDGLGAFSEEVLHAVQVAQSLLSHDPHEDHGVARLEIGLLLFYVPGTFTPTDEVVALARVAGRFGGIHISHMRDEASGWWRASGRRSGSARRVGCPRRSRTTRWWALILGRQRRDAPPGGRGPGQGVNVTIDQYPGTASATSIHSALLPSWVLEGGLAERFADPAAWARAR